MIVTIEHYGGARRTIEVEVNELHQEAYGVWQDKGGYSHTPVTFDLRKGLIVAKIGKRDWRLTQESFNELRAAAGIRKPGHLHRWGQQPKRSPRKPRTPEDPRQLELCR